MVKIFTFDTVYLSLYYSIGFLVFHSFICNVLNNILLSKVFHIITNISSVITFEYIQFNPV